MKIKVIDAKKWRARGFLASRVFGGAVVAFTTLHSTYAQKNENTKTDSKPSATISYTMAVSEGTSGGIDSAEALFKYKPLADYLGKQLGLEIKVVLARDFKRLEESFAKKTFQFVFARPSDYPARAVRDHGYKLLVTVSPDGMCSFIVNKDSKLQKIEDAKGKAIALPEKVAYMSRFCTAELRDRGVLVDKENVQYFREQDGVGFAVEKGFKEVGGVASYSGVAREWEKKGHRVLHTSIKQPYFPLVASPDISAVHIEKLKTALLNLNNSEEGKAILASAKIKGFVAADDKRLLELLKWLGV